TGDAIQFLPQATSSLSVSNTLVGDNGGSGIRVVPSTSSRVKVALSKVESYNNSIHGMFFDGSNMPNQSFHAVLAATVADSVIHNNSGSGVAATSTVPNGEVQVKVIRSEVVNNASAGILASGNSALTAVALGQSTVTGNLGPSWTNNGGPGFVGS